MNLPRKYRVIVFTVSAIAVLFLIGLIASRLWQARPVPDSVLEIAENGVTHNAQWTPLIRRVAGEQMALVPAGCFMMGSTAAQLVEAQDSCQRHTGAFGCREDFTVEQPAHEVCFAHPYWIDLVEVSNRAYGKSSSIEMMRKSSWPRESLSHAVASEYCASRDARLPTEAEWEYAARGPDALIYPWGNEFIGDYVTFFVLHPRPVGSHPEGASWVGALDMSGSIAEWTAEPYAPYGTVTAEAAAAEERFVARGGNWFMRAEYQLRTTTRERLPATFATSVIGVRCVK